MMRIGLSLLRVQEARAYHEHYEGYSKGDAHSRLIVSNVSLQEFMNGTSPCHAQFQDLYQKCRQPPGENSIRRLISKSF